MEQMALIDTGKGDEFTAKAMRWIDENRDAWGWMCRKAQKYAKAGQRFGIGALCEEVRWHMHLEGIDGFKVNNNIRAALARQMIRQFPNVRKYLEIRESACDVSTDSVKQANDL